MNTSGKVYAIIPAAGLGVRMGNTRKQFLRLDGTPILSLTLRKFDACPQVDEIFVAARAEDGHAVREMVASANVSKKVTIVQGGDTRQESVENGLRALPADTKFVAVHDAVRPFVTVSEISAVIHEAERSGGCILAVLCVDTVKQVERTRITATIPRERIVLAQTPQVFRYELLLRAFDQARRDQFTGTDEASLVERLGEDVTVVPGSPRNIKITSPHDLQLAQFYLEQERGEQAAPERKSN
jgi:2-C-methyl-D-erythritol 4-phosphate cytidylyltransferase